MSEHRGISLTSDELDSFPWIMLGVSCAGVVGAIAVMLLAEDGSSGTWRIARCFGGFICSMVWIAAIANEVVDVLLVSRQVDSADFRLSARY